MKIYKLAEYIFDPTDPEASNDQQPKETLNFGDKSHTSTSDVLARVSAALHNKISSWHVLDGSVGWFKFDDGVIYEVSISPAAHGKYFNILKDELLGEKSASSNQKQVKVAFGLDELAKTVDLVLRKVKQNIPRGQYNYAPNGHILESNITFTDEAMGDANIQIMYSQRRNAFSVEKYYDDEVLHNEMGQTKFVPIDLENPEANVNAINFILQSPDFIGDSQEPIAPSEQNQEDIKKMENLF